MWLCSVDKCTPDEFQSSFDLQGNFYPSFPKLWKYIKFCRSERLPDYCLKHIDQVKENLIRILPKDEKDKRLVPSLVKYVDEAEASDNKGNFDIIVKEAYEKLFCSQYPDGALFTAEESGFREDVHRCIECFGGLAGSLHDFKCPELGEAQVDWDKIGAICRAFEEAIDYLDDEKEEEEEEMEVESED